MPLIGNRESFGIELNRDFFAYQLSMYIKGFDILQFEKEGNVYKYRWKNLEDIISWLEENMKYILSDDPFPLKMPGNCAAEKCEISYKLNMDDIHQYEILQEWLFKHSWLSARAGSYLADIYFVKIDNKIEISWDNTNTFKEDEVNFIFPKGCYEVKMDQFEKAMKAMCEIYKKL